MKTDAQLKHDVIAALNGDTTLNAVAVGVHVHDGVVTLTGHPASEAQRWAIERAVDRVAGVQALAFDLTPPPPADSECADTEIARAAERRLAAIDLGRPEAVRVVVDRGAVTLRGSVSSEALRRNAESAVATLPGVVGVRNLLEAQSPMAVREAASRSSR